MDQITLSSCAFCSGVLSIQSPDETRQPDRIRCQQPWRGSSGGRPAAADDGSSSHVATASHQTMHRRTEGHTHRHHRWHWLMAVRDCDSHRLWPPQSGGRRHRPVAPLAVPLVAPTSLRSSAIHVTLACTSHITSHHIAVITQMQTRRQAIRLTELFPLSDLPLPLALPPPLLSARQPSLCKQLCSCTTVHRLTTQSACREPVPPPLASATRIRHCSQTIPGASAPLSSQQRSSGR